MADQVAKERPAARKRRTRYEDDFYTWVSEQVALLRAGRIEDIDAQNIAEELEGVGRSEAAKLRSILRVVLMHMLKWDQQPEHRTRSWIHSIREQRSRLARLMKDNPGLRPRREEALADADESARMWAADETNLPEDEFPDDCPYDWEDILERPFELDSVR